MKLNGIDRFDADITYGNGVFWKDLPKPFFCFDIDESLDGVVHASSTNLPVLDNSFKSVMFDPPFLTYVVEKVAKANQVEELYQQQKADGTEEFSF